MPIVAPERRHKAVISERAIEVRFSQFTNDMFGNAQPLLLNFLVNPKQRVFARRLLPKRFMTTPMPAQEHPPSMVGGRGRSPTHDPAMNRMPTNLELG